jgi:Gas vesicle synthesis protein GvpL/GvpF
MIHLYAFVSCLDALPTQGGVGGEPLEVRSYDDVDAVVGTLRAPVDESLESIVAHGLVSAALLDCADAVLPTRLGPPFPDDAVLAAAVTPRLPELRSRLADVRGCVELTVRIAGLPTATHAAPANGATYLRELGAATAERDSGIAEAHAVLDTHALESRVEPLTRGASFFRAAYLVRRPDVEAFAHEVDRLASRFQHASILCTGPWAPSSFAQEAA